MNPEPDSIIQAYISRLAEVQHRLVLAEVQVAALEARLKEVEPSDGD